MASKARKELRSRTKEEIDRASSGELSMETLGNTIKAMYRGGKAERQLDKEEGLKTAELLSWVLWLVKLYLIFKVI